MVESVFSSTLLALSGRSLFRAVLTMACLGSTRLCVRVQEKLCQLGQSPQVRRKTFSCDRFKFGILPSSRIILHEGKIHKNVSSPTSNTGQSVTWHPCSRPEIAATARTFSTLRTYQPGSLPDYKVDPYHLLEDDLKDVYLDIRKQLRLNTHQEELYEIATYYFDGQGKSLRPMVGILMGRAMNYHMYKDRSAILPSQREVAMIAEMIHSASLIHDDVIDQADFRRGKPSANMLWSHKKVTMAGDFILAIASMMIAKIKNDDVTLVLSQVVTDLVQGEFMQLGSKETENERFAHYLTKTYRKTASLIANTLKAVAMLAGADDDKLPELAFQYGRNVGLAFQLVDDLLDFVSSSEAMGKPAAADLKLGLATAPVLFACEKFPELNPMIMRRFQEKGDVEKAFELVHKSHGLEQTQFLAKQHCQEAIRIANLLRQSPFQKALIVVADLVLNRIK